MSRYHANELLNNRKNDIQHWKYVKKISVGKGYRYFYSWDEYKAYLKDPTVELNKVQNKASTEIKNTRTKAEKYVAKGRKKAEKIVNSKKTSTLTVGSVKKINASRSPSMKEKIKEVGKRASEKWNSGKEGIKEVIEKSKKWIKNLFGKKEDEKDKKEKKKEKAKDPYERYKYVKKLTINGKTRYFYSQEELDTYNKRSYYMKNEPEFMKGMKHSEEPYTKYEDAALVNPNYNPYDNNNNYEYNCRECSMIYELRRRGYDVESNGVSGYIDEDSGFLSRIKDQYRANKYNGMNSLGKQYFENPKIQKLPETTDDFETAKAIRREIDKNPPGSRGEIAVCWKAGGAHSMVWEKDLKGNITIVDTQLSGCGAYRTQSIESLSARVDNTNSIRTGTRTVQITRTDNLQLKQGMTKICKNSSGNVSTKYLGEKWADKSSTVMDEKEKVTYYPVLLEQENRKKKRNNSSDIDVQIMLK